MSGASPAMTTKVSPFRRDARQAGHSRLASWRLFSIKTLRQSLSLLSVYLHCFNLKGTACTWAKINLLDRPADGSWRARESCRSLTLPT
jgi:hypothetical protein